MSVYRFEDVISADDAAILIAASDELGEPEGNRGNHFVTRRPHVVGRQTIDVVTAATKRIGLLINKENIGINTTGKTLVPETVIIDRLQPRGFHPLHADALQLDGTPNHTPQRKIAAMLYLNSDFDGGEIEFPNHDLRIKPYRGLLLVFGTGLEDQHTVHRVESNKRYMLSTWWWNGLQPDAQ